MSLESVKADLAARAPDVEIVELGTSTATVALAAAALGVGEAQIAKTLTLRVGDEVVLLVTCGDARLDNRRSKQHFGARVRMLPADEVERETGHPVGGVCPFGLARPLPVLCDISLKAHAEVFPAGGAVDAAVRIAPDRMAALTGARWVDLMQQPASASHPTPDKETT